MTGARAPRVLVSGVVLDQPMGGVWRHNLELLPRVARVLAEGGGGLVVLAGRAGLALELGAGIEVLPSDVPSRPLLVRAAREARALNAALRAARAAGAPFDLVHVAHLPAPRHLELPYTITLHDLRSLDLPHTPFSRRLVARSVIGRALSGARGVFTVSEWMAERLRRGWPFVADRLTVLPNAADHFTPLPASRERGALLHLGHIEPRKNLELVVRALALDSGLPDLVLAGGAQPEERERLARLARELGVARRVHFPGPFAEADLPRLLARCAAVVLPSRLEGCGIVALEAKRAGAPLAVSTAGALPETAGRNVPCFDPDDAEDCARALRSALVAGAPACPGPDATWDGSAARWAAAWTRLAAGL